MRTKSYGTEFSPKGIAVYPKENADALLSILAGTIAAQGSKPFTICCSSAHNVTH